ncbi:MULTISPECIES: alpha/beta fold hydrolase [unclassified Streptomyces]|uniref:alpha/beta fold hydrolase n=1 Tax=unclassified Streptomyces TaxID=2593676 RepID=UPI00166081A7|nr:MULTISPECIES: alpha/beta fold hydrolase [unclassified Streptomyces]MBD0707040.1 alpha/beta hydrolase [Streptomyces sp. CBMA291]MBD0714297.1 alpha/beta hydrolase [Streptomyces sp. CBMA370]
MRLHTTTWGSGDRTALLVHGLMADHRTWRRVGPALAGRGYRVIAVDLRGHGESARAGGLDGYRPADYADDLVETVPEGVELAVGHSLGGLALAGAVDRLRPARAVYSDPAWRLGRGPNGYRAEVFVRGKSLTREHIGAFNPSWAEADLDAEMASVRLWDERTAYALEPFVGADLWPDRPAVPSLVALADPSTLVSADAARMLAERGFTVRTVAKAGHSIHRDDFEGFMSALDGWI